MTKEIKGAFDGLYSLETPQSREQFMDVLREFPKDGFKLIAPAVIRLGMVRIPIGMRALMFANRIAYGKSYRGYLPMLCGMSDNFCEYIFHSLILNIHHRKLNQTHVDILCELVAWAGLVTTKER